MYANLVSTSCVLLLWFPSVLNRAMISQGWCCFLLLSNSTKVWCCYSELAMIEPQTHLSLSSCVHFYMYAFCLVFCHSHLSIIVLLAECCKVLTGEVGLLRLGSVIMLCCGWRRYMYGVLSKLSLSCLQCSLWTSCKLDLSQAVRVASYSKRWVPINKWLYIIPTLTTCTSIEQLHVHVIGTYFTHCVVTFPDSSPVVFLSRNQLAIDNCSGPSDQQHSMCSNDPFCICLLSSKQDRIDM